MENNNLDMLKFDDIFSDVTPRTTVVEDTDGTFARLRSEMAADTDGTFARLKAEMAAEAATAHNVSIGAIDLDVDMNELASFEL